MIHKKDIGLFVLALIFSFALMFAFVELPRLIDTLLQEKVGFPGFDQGADEFNAFKSDLYINTLYLRWIGYGTLLIIAGAIITGFITKKSGWAWAGAFALFLPVFGQFALSMFFLAGLGILRITWLPFMDISFNFLQLGNIVYLPYEILMWAAGLFNWNAHLFLSYFFMAAGTFLFVWGVLTWLQSRFSGRGVATKTIYRFSRHPQYIGWIIWSYGFMLFSLFQNDMKKSWSVPSSLPWLLSTMVIIGICFVEEIKMKDRYADGYEKYRAKTPFLFPLPYWLKRILNAPMRFILKKDYPTTKSEVAGITLLSMAVLILLSLLRMDLNTEREQLFINTSDNAQHQIDSLITEIRKTPRRYIHAHFEGLKNLGAVSVEPLINLLSDPNPVIREFSADALGDMNADTAAEHLIQLLNDSNFRVRNSAIYSLGRMKSEKALQPLIDRLNEPSGPGLRNFIYSALGGIGSEKALEVLIQGTQDSIWFVKTSAIDALCKINIDTACAVIRSSLSDKNPNVRRNIVYLILKHKIKSLKDAVSILYNDDDFETRFYAKIISEQL
jgi:protein-S-isoprenylcysteine O-methyltransferase Ste14